MKNKIDPSAPPAKNQGKRARTRSALIAAALQVVEEKGFVAASLDDIANRAGMTKGAIYSNFPSRADLMLAVARSQSVKFAPTYEVGAPLAEQLDRVVRSIEAMLPHVQKTARLQAHFQVYLHSEPELRQLMADELTAGLQGLIRQVTKHHAAELTVPAKTLVMAIQAMSLGLAHQAMATPALLTASTVRGAFDMLIRGAAPAAVVDGPAKQSAVTRRRPARTSA